jgi:hypothetical protein
VTDAKGSGARRLLLIGALLTVAGLAVAAVSPIPGTAGSERTGTQQLAGGGMVVFGWAVLGWGVHRFGRGG